MSHVNNKGKYHIRGIESGIKNGNLNTRCNIKKASFNPGARIMGISYRQALRLKECILARDDLKLNLLKAKLELRISNKNKVWVLYKNNVIYETFL